MYLVNKYDPLFHLFQNWMFRWCRGYLGGGVFYKNGQMPDLPKGHGDIIEMIDLVANAQEQKPEKKK